MRPRWIIVGIALLAPVLLGTAPDRGIVLELDRADFSLHAVDLSDGTRGPTLRVVLGSPSHPTPSGVFPLHRVVRNPGWKPGAFARSLGAEPIPPSSEGPLGIGKIPFAAGGEIALHGGADPVLLGKPVSLGCVRAQDRDLEALLGWLESRGALGRLAPHTDGEVHQGFRRPARVVIH